MAQERREEPPAGFPGCPPGPIAEIDSQLAREPTYPPDWWNSVEEVAQILHCKPRMVQMLIEEYKLPASRIGRRMYRVRWSDLNRYMDDRRISPAPVAWRESLGETLLRKITGQYAAVRPPPETGDHHHRSPHEQETEEEEE